MNGKGGSIRNRMEARRQREAEKRERYTVEKLVEDYVAEKLNKQKRGAEGARLLSRDLLPKLGDRATTGLTIGIKGAPQVRRKRAFTDSELAMFIRSSPVAQRR